MQYLHIAQRIRVTKALRGSDKDFHALGHRQDVRQQLLEFWGVSFAKFLVPTFCRIGSRRAEDSLKTKWPPNPAAKAPQVARAAQCTKTHWGKDPAKSQMPEVRRPSRFMMHTSQIFCRPCVQYYEIRAMIWKLWFLFDFLKCVYNIPYTYIWSCLNAVTVANEVWFIKVLRKKTSDDHFPGYRVWAIPNLSRSSDQKLLNHFSARFQVRRPSSGGVSLWFFKWLRGISQYDVHQKLVDFGRKACTTTGT